MQPDTRQAETDADRIEVARAHAAELINADGLRKAARALRVSTEALARLHAGLTVRAGTISLVLDHQRSSRGAA